MSISHVGYASAAASSVALPAFSPGDLALVFAYRDGSNTAPSLASGWIGIGASGSGSNASRTGYRVLSASDTTTGTWANATEIQVLVLRGQHETDPIGGADQEGAANALYIEYGGYDVEEPATSWSVGFGGHRTATDANVGVLAGWTNRSSGSSTPSLSCHTDDSPTDFDFVNFAVSPSGNFRAQTIEVRAPVATATGTARLSLEGAGVPATRTGHALFVRARKTDSALDGRIRVSLYEGSTAIVSDLESVDLTTSFDDYSFAVPDADAAAISSYAALELRIEGVSSGDATVFEVARAGLILPASTAGAVFGATSLDSTASISVDGIVDASGATTTGTARISLEPGFVPETRTNHELHVRARKTSGAVSGEVLLQLWEGASARTGELSTGELTSSLADYVVSIPDADAATIVSYDDLEVRFRGYSSAGDATVYEIAEVSLVILASDTGGDVTGQVVFASTSRLEVTDSDAAIYPADDVYPVGFAAFASDASLAVDTAADALGAISLASSAVLLLGGASPPTDKTGLLSLSSTTSLSVSLGGVTRTGAVEYASVADIFAGSASVQDVAGALSLSATATVGASGDIPGALAGYVDLPLGPDEMLLAAAYASKPLATTQTYTPITSYSREVGSRRGRNWELDRFEAGRADFVLSNLDGRFDPDDPASPYYPDLRATRRLRWAMRWNGVTYDLYNGFLEGYPRQYPRAGTDRLVSQQAVDFFAALALVRLTPGTTTLAADITTVPAENTTSTEIVEVASTGAPMPQATPFDVRIDEETLTVVAILDAGTWRVTRSGDPRTNAKHSAGATVSTETVSFGTQYAGERIASVLSHIGITTGIDLDRGAALLSPSEDLAGSDALSPILLAAEVDSGRFFVSREGFATFRDRQWIFKNELTPRATFGDAHDGVEIPYAEAEITHEQDKIYNVVRVTAASGEVYEARDDDSVDDYFERVLEKDWPLADDNEARSAANYLLYRYREMQTRIPSVDLNGDNLPSAWPTILSLEIGQRHRFRMRPEDSAEIDRELIVEGVAHSYNPRSGVATKVSLSLADPHRYWRLGVSGFSELGSTTRVAY